MDLTFQENHTHSDKATKHCSTYVTYCTFSFFLLSNDNRSLTIYKDVADLETQFPSLAADIKIPKLFPEERFFSSVFRISSAGGQLWTHYDVSLLVSLLVALLRGQNPRFWYLLWVEKKL